MRFRESGYAAVKRNAEKANMNFTDMMRRKNLHNLFPAETGVVSCFGREFSTLS